MLMCNETVTLVQLVREEDKETYVLTEIENASWYGKRIMTQTTQGADSENSYTVRIPEKSFPNGIRPRKGDFLVHGLLEEGIRRAPADFSDREYFCILSAGNNARGRRRLRHWVISGK